MDSDQTDDSITLGCVGSNGQRRHSIFGKTSLYASGNSLIRIGRSPTCMTRLCEIKIETEPLR